jgi:hypothetical protein
VCNFIHIGLDSQLESPAGVRMAPSCAPSQTYQVRWGRGLALHEAKASEADLHLVPTDKGVLPCNLAVALQSGQWVRRWFPECGRATLIVVRQC